MSIWLGVLTSQGTILPLSFSYASTAFTSGSNLQTRSVTTVPGTGGGTATYAVSSVRPSGATVSPAVLPTGVTFNTANGTFTGPASGGWSYSVSRLSDFDRMTYATMSDGTVKVFGRGSAVGPEVALNNVSQFERGYDFRCALLTSGQVRCWGSNAYGQLGDGTTTSSSDPVTVVGITTATQIALGYSFGCARLTDGTVRCWGRIYSGLTYSTPTALSGITTATQVGVGESAVYCRLSDGTGRAVGYNGFGQLGDGTTTDRATPVTISGLTGATKIMAGSRHACAVLSGGGARCWGENTVGQLGSGQTVSQAGCLFSGTFYPESQFPQSTCSAFGGTWTTQNVPAPSNTPVAVSGITTATDISASGFSTSGFSCARLSNSTLRCWGGGSGGQLGSGSTANASTPVTVTGVSTATNINANWGAGGASALLSNGSVASWGTFHVPGSATTIGSTPATIAASTLSAPGNFGLSLRVTATDAAGPSSITVTLTIV